ncbi:unnamed protein product [Psylliodes chrysocephalus]|uniref:Uncharacterized protein n=1 Tax=Psylliodes chrysocephalus TaxID=3402493 RepID=A0A9P0CVQ7_9CUCU|nr:unnamed protein product [Psylliodes chrysocephala]
MVYERYQEVKDLYGEKESSEEIRYLTNFTKVRLRNGETREKGKRVYIIPTEFDTEKGVEDEKIGEMLLRLKEDITRDERKKCIFAAADGINRAKCRTILECLFSNIETEIICRLPGNRSTDGENKVKRPIDSKVTIKAGNETYANLLKKFKGNVDIEKIGVDIRRIRKAGKEYLILTVAGGQKKAETLKTKIMKNMQDMRVSTKKRGTIIYIMGMDSTTTKDEVEEALMTEGMIEEEIDIKSTRLGRYEEQTATRKTGTVEPEAESIVTDNEIENTENEIETENTEDEVERNRQLMEEEAIIEEWRKRGGTLRVKRTPPNCKLQIRLEGQSKTTGLDSPVTPQINSAGYIDDNIFSSPMFNLQGEGRMEESDAAEEDRKRGRSSEDDEDQFLRDIITGGNTEERKDRTQGETRDTKRKKVGTPPNIDERRERDQSLNEGMDRLYRIVEELSRLAGKNVNTKREIKENIVELTMAVQEMSVLIDHLREPSRPTQKDAGTQISHPTIFLTREDVDDDAKGNWEVIDRTCDLKWAKDAFTKTAIHEGNPTAMSGNIYTVILYNPAEGPTNINMAKQEHIKDVIEMGKIEKGTVALLQNTRHQNIDGQTLTKKTGRSILLAGLCKQEEDNFRMLVKLKERLKKEEVKKAAMLVDPKALSERLRKIIECVFRAEEMEVMIFNMDTELELDRNNISSEGWTLAHRRQRKEYETQALIVEARGKTYAELLRDVRNKVSAEDVGDRVRDLKKPGVGTCW